MNTILLLVNGIKKALICLRSTLQKYKVNNEYYFVTSEWYKESINLFKEYITKINQE